MRDGQLPHQLPGRRRLASRRGVLEGLPLSLIISIIIIAIGTTILLGLFVYSRGHTLSSVSLSTPSGALTGGNVYGAWKQPLLFLVTAWASSGGALPGVLVAVEGCGFDELNHTASNGTAMFVLPPPTIPQHSSGCVMPVQATYQPPASLGATASQTYSTSVVIVA